MARKQRRKRQAKPSPPGRPERQPRLSWDQLENTLWFLPVLALAGLFMAVLLFDRNLSLSGDNAQFIVLGRSLASGHGLSETLGIEPIPHTKYPFGFPLMLAVVETVFPHNILALKGLVALLYASAIPVIYRLVRSYATAPMALSVCLLCLVSSALLDFSHQVMSEVPFLAASFLALLMLKYAAVTQSRKALGFAILALMGAYYIRTAGLALIGSGIVFFVLHRRFKDATIIAGVAFLLALPWYLRNAALGGGGVYIGQVLSVDPYRQEQGLLSISTLMERILANLRIYGLSEIPRLFVPGFVARGDASWFFGLIIGAILLYAVAQGLRRRELPAVYLVFYLAMCLLWPQVWSGTRFLLPVIPLIFYAVLCGASDLLGRLATRISALSPAPILVMLILISLGSNVYATRQLAAQIGDYPANWRNYFDAGIWIRQHTDPDVIVACRKPYLIHITANRKVTGYLWGSPEEIIRDFEKHNVGIVVVDQLGFSSTPRYLVPAVNALRNQFRVLHIISNPDTYILAFSRNP